MTRIHNTGIKKDLDRIAAGRETIWRKHKGNGERLGD